MDRDAFPTLTEGETGWPVMHVPWTPGGSTVRIEVSEDPDLGSRPVIKISTPGVEPLITVNGERWGGHYAAS